MNLNMYIEGDGPPYTGFGTFLCENVENPNEKAIMKITMQYKPLSDLPFLPTDSIYGRLSCRIPYEGSELAPLAE